MKKIIVSIILLLIVTFQLTAQDKQPFIISGADAYTINSKINQKVYNMAVSLPFNYDKSKQYPTYYILDGFYAFPIIAESHKNDGWLEIKQSN